jgi:hypothetical protein
MEMALGRIHTDIVRMSALLDLTGRVMNAFEAQTMTGYLRCLGSIARAKGPGDKKLGDKSWEELVEMARQIPELRDVMGQQ